MDLKDLSPEQIAEIKRIKDSLRVSKVVATRALKTKRGDFFVGLSAAWDSVQEDAGSFGPDLIDALEEGEQSEAIAQRGQTLKYARISSYILGMQVDIQAHAHALAGGAMSPEEYRLAEKAIKVNYGKLIAEVMLGRGGE